MQGYSWEQYAERVKRMLQPERWQHTLRVVETAERLAKLHGVDVEKARIAALLHDCAKELPKNHLLKSIEELGIVMDEIEMANEALWHAPAGAALAYREFGVRDEEIFSAIRYHTTGRAGMSCLEKIIYVADMIEPHRQFPGVERIRELVQEDLDKGCLAAFDASISYVIKKGYLLHLGTCEARNRLLLQMERR